MKKILWVLCAMLIIACLAGGCQSDLSDSQPSTAVLPEDTTAPKPTEPADIRPLPPEEPGSSLCEYDPDRQIYIDSENVYMDYYHGVTRNASISFHIYSKNYLDPESITATVPVDLPLLVSVKYVEGVEQKTSAMLDDNFGEQTGGDFVMPYYVYQAYRGVDFAALLAAKRDDTPEENPETIAALEEDARLRSDFARLQASDLPEFYVYSVSVAFVNIQELQEAVVLEKVDVTIGNVTYEAKLGGVRLFPKEMFPADVPIKGQRGVVGRYYGLYNDGIATLGTAYVAENIQEDMTLTSLRFAEEETQILEILVTTQTSQGAMESVWDGKSPIYLYKGDSIIISVTVKDDRTLGLRSSVLWHTIVEYRDGQNEQRCAVTSQEKGIGWNFYELYAIMFDGVDMESYYRDYLYASLKNE